MLTPTTGVLGKPDTGGQIVYILDQVRALETEMLKRIDEAGLAIEPGVPLDHAWTLAVAGRSLWACGHMPFDHRCMHCHADIIIVTRLIPEAQGTTCNQRIEKIHDTKHCTILRVPFRDGE